MKFKPKSRTQEYSDNNGVRTYRCYNYSNPHYYKDKNGDLYPIDQNYSQSLSNSNIDSFQLFSKNINSVGIRTDNNTNKYIGIRPDNTQEDGTQQLEWSIENININGNNIAPDLSKFETSGSFKNLGNISIHSTRQFTRQMVHYTSSIEDFQIKYKLNLKGLQISNDKYTENTNIRNSVSCSLIDCGDISANDYYSMTELQTSSDSILSMYFTDDALFQNPNFIPNPYYNYNNEGPKMMSGSEFTVDTGSNFSIVKTDETFWGSDSLEKDMISSAYLKDTILLRFKNKYLGSRIKKYICDLLGVYDDNGYMRINGGKKVGWYGNPCNDDMPFLTLALKDITHISSSFRYKKFDDFSHITSSYSDIINGIKTQLNSSDSISISTGYYKPDENNNFVIKDDNNKVRYNISSPVLLNSKYENVTNDTIHSLKDNGDGTYDYIKYPSRNLWLNGISESVNYIDSNTIYSEGGTTDGHVNSDLEFWDKSHDNTLGQSADSVGYAVRSFVLGWVVGKTTTFRIYRGFFGFNTSGISGAVQSVDFKYYVHWGFSSTHAGVNNNMTEYRFVKGTQDTGSFGTSTYNDFEGWNTTWGPSDPTYYSDSEDWSGVSNYQLVSSSLNEQAEKDVVNEDIFKTVVLSRADWRDNLNMNGGNYTAGGIYMFSSDLSATTYDPYLEITIPLQYYPNLTIKSGQMVIEGGTLTLMGD